MEDLSAYHYPVADAIDRAIIMHREVHFGGLFSIMLEYYQKQKIGVQKEFSIKRIATLADLEAQIKQNLAPLLLEGAEIEAVAHNKELYRSLKKIYDIAPSSPSALISDLILTENEGNKVITAIIEQKEKTTPLLIELIKSPLFYDTLAPGYGRAPFLAIQCLEKIGDKRALFVLFEQIGKEFFVEDVILSALKAIGEEAKKFLLLKVKSKPINEDNCKAAIALSVFKEEADVPQTCFELVQDKEIQKDPLLSTYLLLVCSGFRTAMQKEQFRKWVESSDFPHYLLSEAKMIFKEWEELNNNAKISPLC